jgi:transcriptional regulator with XRE-family HTH domain
MVELNTEAIGIVIRDLRKQKKMSQEVLSGFAQIARSHLAMIETGDKVPNLQTIWRIAIALEMHPYEIIKMIEGASSDS